MEFDYGPVVVFIVLFFVSLFLLKKYYWHIVFSMTNIPTTPLSVHAMARMHAAWVDIAIAPLLIRTRFHADALAT